jgi:hypothetical protein
VIVLTFQVDATAPAGTLEAVRAGLNVGAPGPVRQGLGDAVDRFEAWLRRRFDRLSRGGGEWPPLAPSTLRRKLASGRTTISSGRRVNNRARTAAAGRILVETGALRESLEFSGKNHVRMSIPNGIRTGSKDPKIAYHQFGTSRIPARTVYVPPTPEVARLMAADFAVGIRKMMEQRAAAAAAR